MSGFDFQRCCGGSDDDPKEHTFDCPLLEKHLTPQERAIYVAAFQTFPSNGAMSNLQRDVLVLSWRLAESRSRTPVDKFVDLLKQNIESKIEVLGGTGIPMEPALRLVLSDLSHLKKLVED